MEIGLELVTETSLFLTPNHSFRMELYAGDVLLPLSIGTDVYNYNCNIWPNKTVAATGRKAVHELKVALGPFEAEPARAIAIREEDLPGLKLKLANNKILDQAELKHGFSLRVSLAGRVLDIPLARPDVRVYWERRGEFTVPLGDLVA
ncbi:MAG: hypothetical protein QHH10_05790 [Peptococcaceae bacterium]|jgi:hypothetical protein|nr:hypothetical protein [Peptococcaceae bacterium]MDH7524813.1 hypothetical protein [Peptococcaceae bacterium]